MEKIIVITGGSDGLGRVLATDLAKDNGVIILSNNEEQLKEAMDEIGCDSYFCDVRDYGQVEEVMSDIVERYGKIDVLINNAGLLIQGELDMNDAEKIKAVIDVNLLGVINCAKAVIPSMKQQSDGIILNINSQSGVIIKPNRSIYNASKWGLTGFTRSLQNEVAKHGIRVTDIMPGTIKTNLWKNNGYNRETPEDALDSSEVSRFIQFIIDTPKDVAIYEIGIRNTNDYYTMCFQQDSE